MNESTIWNLKAKLYKLFRNQLPFNYFLRQENKSLLSLIELVPQTFPTVLDLGTGEGNALDIISSSVIKFGVDFNLSMLINARNRVNANLINSELLHLSIKNEIADLVLIIGVLEYFSDINPVFREIRRISKTNTHVIISYSPNNIWTFLRQFLGNKIYPLKSDKIVSIIERNGFQFIEQHRLLMQHQMLIKKISC